MAKAVLLSIRPEWVEKIVDGRKTVEIRKSHPRIPTPFKCFIYCTKDPQKKFWTGPRYSYVDDHSHNAFDICGSGKVIGEFVCDKVYKVIKSGSSYIVDGADRGKTNEVAMESCLGFDEMRAYLGTHTGYAWHISKIQIYDKPRELGELRKWCRNSWYCESCAMFNANDEVCGNAALEVRPPQSWCYVEDLGNG